MARTIAAMSVGDLVEAIAHNVWEKRDHIKYDEEVSCGERSYSAPDEPTHNEDGTRRPVYTRLMNLKSQMSAQERIDKLKAELIARFDQKRFQLTLREWIAQHTGHDVEVTEDVPKPLEDETAEEQALNRWPTHYVRYCKTCNSIYRFTSWQLKLQPDIFTL